MVSAGLTDETDDALNKAAGGCASGFAAGLAGMSYVEEDLTAARNLPMAFGACAGMGILMGTFEAAGNVSASSSPLISVARRRRSPARVS